MSKRGEGLGNGHITDERAEDWLSHGTRPHHMSKRGGGLGNGHITDERAEDWLSDGKEQTKERRRRVG